MAGLSVRQIVIRQLLPSPFRLPVEGVSDALVSVDRPRLSAGDSLPSRDQSARRFHVGLLAGLDRTLASAVLAVEAKKAAVRATYSRRTRRTGGAWLELRTLKLFTNVRYPKVVGRPYRQRHSVGPDPAATNETVSHSCLILPQGDPMTAMKVLAARAPNDASKSNESLPQPTRPVRRSSAEQWTHSRSLRRSCAVSSRRPTTGVSHGNPSEVPWDSGAERLTDVIGAGLTACRAREVLTPGSPLRCAAGKRLSAKRAPRAALEDVSSASANSGGSCRDTRLSISNALISLLVLESPDSTRDWSG